MVAAYPNFGVSIPIRAPCATQRIYFGELGLNCHRHLAPLLVTGLDPDIGPKPTGINLRVIHIRLKHVNWFEAWSKHIFFHLVGREQIQTTIVSLSFPRGSHAHDPQKDLGPRHVCHSPAVGQSAQKPEESSSWPNKAAWEAGFAFCFACCQDRRAGLFCGWAPRDGGRHLLGAAARLSGEPGGGGASDVVVGGSKLTSQNSLPPLLDFELFWEERRKEFGHFSGQSTQELSIGDCLGSWLINT